MEDMELQQGTEAQDAAAIPANDEIVNDGRKLSDRVNEEALFSSAYDLTKAEKVKWFDGKEYAPSEIKNGYLRQSDYTKKAQALAEERKYYDNIDIDLQKVLENPRLATQFKEVYPEKFHRILDSVLSRVQPSAKDSVKEAANASSQKDPRLDEVYSFYQEQATKLAEAEINSTFDKLGKKYQYANESDVINIAMSKLDELQEIARMRGEKAPKITEKDYEALFKASHEENLKKYNAWKASEHNAQKQATEKAKTVGSGGGIPGQAPRSPKNIKEATQWAMQDPDFMNS